VKGETSRYEKEKRREYRVYDKIYEKLLKKRGEEVGELRKK
jgi:hypothetical protein